MRPSLRRSRRSWGTPWYKRPGVWLAAGIALVLLIAVVALTVSYAQTSDETLRITGKESVSTGHDGGHEYRVYTNQGTFKVTDSIVHPRFNSADVYGRLETGKTYNCTVYGYRIPFFSSFKNILHCTEE